MFALYQPTPTEESTMSKESKSMTLKEWILAGVKQYDKQAEFQEHIAPLAKALVDECEKRGIPVSVIACHTQALDRNGCHVIGYTPCDGSTPAEVMACTLSIPVGQQRTDLMDALANADEMRTVIAVAQSKESTPQNTVH